MTAPAEMTHPAARAVHAVNNALQIAASFRDATPSMDPVEDVTADGARLVELLSTVPLDIAVLQQHIEALEADLRGLRDQGIADAREITRLRDRNEALNEALRDANTRSALASKELEHLYATTSMDVDRASTRFNAVVRARDALDPTVTSLGTGALLQRASAAPVTAPRSAAGAN